MKYRITQKLVLLITSLLLIFSVIMGLSFSVLFNRHMVDFHRDDMAKRAEIIASTFSEYLGTTSGTGGHGMGMSGMRGFMPYLQVIDDIAMGDVWIVDENEEFILMGRTSQINYRELPEAASEVIEAAMEGKISFSEDFSDVLGVRTLTVGAPVPDETQTQAVVLLHAPIGGLESVTLSGLRIFAVSSLVALVLSSMLAVILSMKFVRPLKKMTAAASRLGEGDYSAKTDIRQNDEIGDLALTLDTLSERLDEASRESERLEQSRRDFIASISHELRTPVTVLRGSLEALKDKVIRDPKLVEEYHNQMHLEILALQRLVDDLLSLTKLQNPDFKMQMEDVNLSEVLSDVVRSMGTVAKERDITILYNNPYDFLSYHGDYGRLRQMIMAVLDNAVKFSRHSGKVSVDVSCREDECRIMVEDNGQGIQKEDLDRVFERFYRHKGAETFTGTGLGLSIVKEIADRHGIHIGVSSEPEVKTVFTFTFTVGRSLPSS